MQRVCIAGGLSVGLALGGYGIAFAASSSSSTSSTTNPKQGPATGPRHGHFGLGPFGGLGSLGKLGGLVHGSFTVRTPSGTYETVLVQSGEATPAGSSSIMVKSSDGYTRTYSVTTNTVVNSQRDGISSIAHGDQVYVLATTVGGKDTAAYIVDTTKIGASRNAFGFGGGVPGLLGPGHGKKGPGAGAAAALFAQGL